ncbi:MAG TPA: HAD family hydrolase [Beijerinckiaceae bacterium]|nr:HAD family hydrolase [Beijerinckiaceae bacterium]
MIKAVLFDVDGTLIDSVDLHARAWQEALAHCGYDVAFEAVRSQIGKGGDQLMPVFVPKDDLKRRGEELETYRGDLFKRKYLPHVRPFPKVRDLFERLRADRKTIVLASSGKAEEVRRYMDIARIADLIDASTSSDEVERSKPYGDIFAAALGKAAPARAEEAIVIGDTPYDAQAAGKVGLRTIGVLCGGFPEADLRAAGCSAIFRDPADLLARYEHSPLAE